MASFVGRLGKPKMTGAIRCPPSPWVGLSVLLAVIAVAAAGVDRKVIFDLAPAGYQRSVELFASWVRDIEIEPGVPGAELPHILPGPLDRWAGGLPHALRFRLRARPAGGLVLHLHAVETHEAAPPRLAVEVNGVALASVQMQPGTGLPPPHEARGVRSHYSVRIPDRALAGAGEVSLGLSNGAGSWVMWERIRLVEAKRTFAWTALRRAGPPPRLSGAFLAASLGSALLASLHAARAPRVRWRIGGPAVALVLLGLAYVVPAEVPRLASLPRWVWLALPAGCLAVGASVHVRVFPKVAGGLRRLLAQVGLVAVLGTVAAFLVIEPSPVWAPDYGSYIAISRSLVFDQDLLFINDLPLVSAPVWITPTGFALDHHHIGSVLLRLPFHALGHLAATLAGWGGSPAARQGVEPPYVLWLKLGDWTYGLLALLVTYRLVRRHTRAGPAGGAVALIALGSPFFYYMSFFGPSSHVVSALLAAVFLLVWDRSRGDAGWGRWAWLGGLGGLLLLTHTNNVVFLLFPAVELAWETMRTRRWLPGLGRASVLGLFVLLGALPQLVVWWFIFGTLSTPYGRYVTPEQPQILSVLLSPYHGLFFYAPVLALATLGLLALWRRDRLLATAGVAALALLTYGNGSSLVWWAGSSFGQRHFLNATPLFALGLGTLLDVGLPRLAALGLRAAAVALALWTYGLFLQFLSGTIDLMRYVPPHLLLRNQWDIVLSRLPELVQLQLSRANPALLFPSLLLFPLVLAAALWAARAVWAREPARPVGRGTVTGLAGLLVALNAFTALAGVRGEGARARYAAQGYYASGMRVWAFDPWQMASSYVERAQYRQQIGDLAGAREDLRKALGILPDHAEARELLRALQAQ